MRVVLERGVVDVHGGERALGDAREVDVPPRVDRQAADIDVPVAPGRVVAREPPEVAIRVVLQRGVLEDVKDSNPNLEGISSLVHEEEVIGIELPPTVDLRIVACDPAMKGNSSTGRTKPATLESELVVQVPEHIDNGELVRVRPV